MPSADSKKYTDSGQVFDNVYSDEPEKQVGLIIFGRIHEEDKDGRITTNIISVLMQFKNDLAGKS